MDKIDIISSQGEYGVYFGDFYLARNFVKNKCLIITDNNVAPLYLNSLIECLNGFNVHYLILDSGEQIKDKEYLFKIYDKALDIFLNRQDTIIALGGGVIGDLAGFAAGTYMRGVNFINIPTTLIAMVDSSCGGKVAINHERGKNLIGMFYQPIAVIVNTHVLSTLDKRQVSCGMAEVIKYACIYDKHFFQQLHENIDIKYVIKKCIQIKSEFVKEDTFDRGRRMLLNFGHTIGHCIEREAGYGNILHGEAIATGMVLEARLGERLNITKKGVGSCIGRLLELYNLPFHEVDIHFIKHDKKCSSNGINFALLEDIGSAKVHMISYNILKELNLW